MKFETDYIEKLAGIVEEKGLTELSLEDGERTIVIRKEIFAAQIAPQAILPAAPITASVPTPSIQESKPQTIIVDKPKGTPITSPMVGTFYRASSPGSDPFVEEGKVVSKGQVVCIIEAMKLMNEIESEVSGKVVEICAQDGEPVEFGQVLMYVE